MHYKCPQLCLVYFLATASFGNAQEPLRWKLSPGDRLNFDIVQDLQITGSDPLQEIDNQSHQQLDLTWEVDHVDDDGTSTVRLHVNRIRAKMTLPAGGLEYDSAAEGPVIGMAALNAPLYQALVKSPVTFTMSADGYVTGVTLPEDVQAVLKRMPTSATLGDLAQPERFQALLLPGFPTLPPQASPMPGFEWSAKSAAELPDGGTQVIESNYLFESLRETNGNRVAVLRLARVLRFEYSDSPARTTKDQSSESEILFDTTTGQLRSSMLKHRATIAVHQGSINGEQQLALTIQVNPPETDD